MSTRRNSSKAKPNKNDQGLFLRWEGITYDAQLSEVAAKSGAEGAGKRIKRILNGITAQVHSNGMCAIMGPSGSGKTSLLHILTGRRQATGGDINVNGSTMDKPSLKRHSGFVTQSSVFLDALTVRETLTYTALLRLGRHMTWAEKRERAEQVLFEVDLAKVANSQVGNEVVGGISGGERRRLTVAMEIVHRPRILYLDEPSSGLDAASAQKLGEMLRRLCADGCSVLCTIHQPRESLLGMFDSLLLLAEGHMVYFGPIGFERRIDKSDPTSGVLSYFASVGYECPAFTNPADYLLDVLFSPEKPKAAAITVRRPPPAAAAETPPPRGGSLTPFESIFQALGWGGTPAPRAPPVSAPTEATGEPPGDIEEGVEDADSPGPNGEDPRVILRLRLATELNEKYEKSRAAKAAMTPPAEVQFSLVPLGETTVSYPETWFVQFAVLWIRAFKYKLREPAAVMTQATTAIVLPLLVGGIYWHISLHQTAIFDRLAAISFIVLMQGFMCYDQILLIAKERGVYLRDHTTGIYRTSAFYLSRICAELPFILSFAWLAATIAYWMYGFQANATTYFTFSVIIVVVTEAGASLLNSLGALAPTMETANLLGTMVLVILMLFDGFYINLNNLPAWCKWVHYLSFMSYGVQAAAVNQFRGLVFSCTPEEAAVGCIKTGEDFLLRQGFGKVNIWANVGYLVIFSACNRFLSYMSLRFLHTGQTLKERWNS